MSARVRLAGILGRLGIATDRTSGAYGDERSVTRINVLDLRPQTRDMPIEVRIDSANSIYGAHPTATHEAAQDARDTAAALRILLHEFLECVTVGGKRPLDPHAHPELEARLVAEAERTIMTSAHLFGARSSAWDPTDHEHWRDR